MNESSITRCAVAIAAAVALALVLHAKDRAHRDAPTLALRADVKMILVPVIVTDRSGRAVNGLSQSNFTVSDNRTSQQITSFSNEDTPCSVGLILDISGSMRNSIGVAKNVLSAVLAGANSQDEFFTLAVSSTPVTYSGAVTSVSEFTSDTDSVANSIRSAVPGGSTALLDTVYMALQKTRLARNRRRALLILSDGMDNHSRHTMRDVLRIAEEADVQIYTVAIQKGQAGKKPIELVEQNLALNFLDTLARKTGGLQFLITDPREAGIAAGNIGLALHNQYVIGYRPADADGSSKWHKLKVMLNDPTRRVYARTGYYSR